MKTPGTNIVAASVSLFMAASALGLQPEVLYEFKLGPRSPDTGLAQGSDGDLYGTTPVGGASDLGTVFRVTTNGVLTTLVSFKGGTNGALPQGLVLGNDGNFYGTTFYGGSTYPYGMGTVFQVTTNGVLTTLVLFDGTNGGSPNAGLALGSDGNFYGTTSGDGSGLAGTVFKVSTSGVLTTLVSFNGNGAFPNAGLALGSDGNFYGTTSGDASAYPVVMGTVFQVTTNGVLTTLVSFNETNGASPNAGLVLGNDGSFYGTTSGGGIGAGTVFKVSTSGVLTTLVSFDGTIGALPEAGLALGRDGNFYGTTSGSAGWDFLDPFGTVFKMTTNGVLTTLVSFNWTNGATPRAGLVLGNDGSFYGTTSGGGGNYPDGMGTVFQVTTNGVLTTLVSFLDENGADPSTGLVLGNDDNLYGTTYSGGSEDRGTLFKVTTDGVLTTLASFTDITGGGPENGLVLSSDGNFYGTGGGTLFRVTTSGLLTTLASFNDPNYGAGRGTLVSGGDGSFYGITDSSYGPYGSNVLSYGTVFKLTTGGVLTTLVSFNGTNGASPEAGLVWGKDGNLYGTTSEGGSSGRGTVFKVSPTGALTSLVSFNNVNGSVPWAALVLGSDENFYGTTAGGGSLGQGTMFRVTTNGVLTTLVSFGGANGADPFPGVVLGGDGNFYGTTYEGGVVNASYPNGMGTVFRATANGELTTLISFNGANGAYPMARLVLGRDGNLYGTTSEGGSGGGGTIFRLVMPRLSEVAKQPDGSLRLTGRGPANEGYRLWAGADLSLPFSSWTVLTTNAFASNGVFSYTDASAATNSSRFYRLSVP